jgi:hypothetical protein
MNWKKTLAHPLSRLSVREGRILHGTTPENEREYMATPEVTISAKKEARTAADGVRTAFIFQLSHAPDNLWLELFNRNIAELPPGILRSEVKVEVESDQLTLSCLPSHLERIYAFVKSTVAVTNTDYAVEKTELACQLETQGQTAEIEGLPEKNKIEAAKKQFENLQL